MEKRALCFLTKRFDVAGVHSSRVTQSRSSKRCIQTYVPTIEKTMPIRTRCDAYLGTNES